MVYPTAGSAAFQPFQCLRGHAVLRQLGNQPRAHLFGHPRVAFDLRNQARPAFGVQSDHVRLVWLQLPVSVLPQGAHQNARAQHRADLADNL